LDPELVELEITAMDPQSHPKFDMIKLETEQNSTKSQDRKFSYQLSYYVKKRLTR